MYFNLQWFATPPMPTKSKWSTQEWISATTAESAHRAGTRASMCCFVQCCPNKDHPLLELSKKICALASMIREGVKKGKQLSRVPLSLDPHSLSRSFFRFKNTLKRAEKQFFLTKKHMLYGWRDPLLMEMR